MSPARGGAPLLRARRLAASRAGRPVFAGVDLDLHPGEVTALLGPNGAGKSTLLEVLAGLLRPSAGTVERRGRVALALQAPDLARRSVQANVELALEWWGVTRAERPDRARAALDALHAGHLADRPARALSGGERRRVHLARAVAVRPDVLLLDEPFAGLDTATRAGLLDDTGAALRAWASASLVVVHDRAEAWALADRLLILLDGRVAADGAPHDLLEAPPTAPVARFLGFDGEVTRPGGAILLTRPHHVVVDPDGPLRARVERVIALEDGLRLELRVDGGRVHAHVPRPGPARGEDISLRLVGGATFASAPASPHDEPTVPPERPQAVRP